MDTHEMIPDRTKTYETPWDNRDHISQLIQATNQGIYGIDVEGSCTFINKSGLAMLGYRLEECVGKNMHDLIHHSYANGSPYPIQECPIFHAKTTGIGYQVNNEVLWRKDGTYFHAEYSSFPIVDKEKILGAVVTFLDITERQQVDILLRENEQNYRSLADSGQALVWTAGTDKLCNYFNRVWLKFTGRTLEQELGNGWAEGVHPDDLQHCLDIYVGAFDRRENFSMVYRLLRHDGEYRWILDDGCPRYNSNHEFVGYIGHCLDITDQKLAEEARKSSMALLETILESTDNGILVVNRDGSILKVNRRFKEMWRIPDDVLAIGEDEKLLAHILRQLSDPSAFLTKVRELYGEPTIESFDIVYFLDGRIFERTSKPMLVAGRPEGRAWSFHDITERKANEEALRESEERYRAIVENTGEGIGFVNTEERFVFANSAAEAIFGVRSGELAGMSLGQFVSKTQFSQIREETSTRMLGNKSVYELDIVKPNGEKRNIIVTAVAHIDKERGFVGTYGVFRDITERKETEQLLRNMQRRESIGTLSAGIAHDYNNLLGAMMGNISLAQSQLPSYHPAVKNMEKALAAMERAATLTQQMLAYSGKGAFHIRTFDLCSVVREHANLFTVSLSKNVRLNTHIPSTPIYVNGDEGQIEQVIMNLISNGSEAIGDVPGAVSITLSVVTLTTEELVRFGRFVHTTLREGRYAVLEVSDTGCGMSSDTLTKIFDPFFTTKFTGRGLGLSALLGIVQGHKGGIAVESAEGVGTTFHILLAATAPPVSLLVPASAGMPSKKMETTILVIDDEADVAAMAQEMLETDGYATLVEANPIQGIEVYREHRARIAAVLLDMTMPEMSGKEVMASLRAIDAGCKIIITSGYSEEEVSRKLGTAPVSGFILKPYRLQSLLAIVRSVTATAL